MSVKLYYLGPGPFEKRMADDDRHFGNLVAEIKKK
jgi:hypothetical protein